MENNNYGKRPLWQWIAIYVIGAAIVYGLIYYFFLAKQGNNIYQSTKTPTTINVNNTNTQN